VTTFSEMAAEWIREHLAPPTSEERRAGGMNVHEYTAWVEDFHHWALDRCAYRDRCFSGMGALHSDFCEWSITRGLVPCQRRVFDVLVDTAGFLSADGLVHGLLLRADVEALRP
jgi:hypothetical protein